MASPSHRWAKFLYRLSEAWASFEWPVRFKVRTMAESLGLVKEDDGQFQAFSSPTAYFPDSLTILYDRAKLIEGEILKDHGTLMTRVGASFGALLALLSGMVGARDTLYWRLASDNSGSMPFVYTEGVLVVLIAIGLMSAYSVITIRISPRLEAGHEMRD